MRHFRRIILNNILKFRQSQILEYGSSNKITVDDSNFNEKIVEHTYNTSSHNGKIYFENDLTSINDNTFKNTLLNSITINSNIKHIGSYAFQCPNMVHLHIVSDIESIGTTPFYNCTGGLYINGQILDSMFKDNAFDNIIFGEKVTNIPVMAFSSSNNIKTINIPDSIIEISDGAFAYCDKLEEVIITDNIVNAGLNIFGYCSNLKYIKLPNIEYVPGRICNNCSSLESITIPNNVITIKQYAFNLCSSLKNIQFSNNLKIIEECSFSNCAIENIQLPEKLETINNNAFSNCKLLTQIIFNKNITKLDYNAFRFCDKLSLIDFSNSILVPTLGTYVFDNISDTYNIIVPDALYDDWIVARNWSTYASNIIKKSDWDALQTN